MNVTDQKEIIFTPEAKGMRVLPSSKGASVNFSRLKEMREIKLKTPRLARIGRMENPAGYTKLKEEARFSKVSAGAALFLQSDSQETTTGAETPKLRAASNFAGLDDTSWTPPDGQIAAGPDHLLIAVNAALAIFDKTGRQMLRINLADLFSQLIQDAIIFSPRIIYDQFRDGWVIAACAQSVDERRSWFLFAYSTGPTPLDDWFIWALAADFNGKNRTGHWADDISLSVDNNWLYLTTNMFSANARFLYSKLRIVNKKEMQSGGVLHGWDFWELRNADGSMAFGVQPALNLRAAVAQYLLNATNDGQGLTQWSVTYAARQEPVLKRRFIPTRSFQLAPNAKQLPASAEIETGDTRLANVVFRHGMLWTAHTVAAGWGGESNTAAIHWLQLNARAGSVTQQGIYGAAHLHYFCPAVMPDGEGNLVMVFNRVGESEFPSIRFTGRLTSDEPDALQASALLQQSSGAGSAEWSMRSAVACTPKDSTIWMIGQYASADEHWATWIGAATYSEPDVQTNELNIGETSHE